MNIHTVSNVTKEYSDMIKVYIYKEPRVYTVNDGGRRKRSREEVSDVNYEPSITSLNRTKTLIKDLVLANDFEMFCTFTFNPDKVDRYDYGRCYHKMSTWLHHQQDKAGEAGKKFKYLVVPEQHKDGAWHFHALISGYSSTLKDSGHKSSSGRPIYNMTSFRSGFSTAVMVDNKEAVSSYVTKYITKDFIKHFNQRRFTCSRNLNRPIKTTNSSIFRNTLPIFRRQIADFNDTLVYQIDKNAVDF